MRIELVPPGVLCHVETAATVLQETRIPIDAHQVGLELGRFAGKR